MVHRISLIILALAIFTTKSFGAISLDEATKLFRQNKAFEVELKISFDGDNSIKEHQKATLTILDDMFSLQMVDQHIFCDGENSYTYTPSEKEIVIEKKDTISPLYSPRSLLTLDSSLFFVTKVNSTTSLYTLKNNENIMGVESIILSVTKHCLKYITIIDNANNKINIEITSVDFNVKRNTKLFLFNPKEYKGVEIIDFR